MTDLDLDAIKARLEDATLGPWERVREDNKDLVVRRFEFFGGQFEVVTGDIVEDDAEFIAHARTDVPALVAEVERLRQAIGNAHAVDARGIQYGDSDRKRLEDVFAALSISGVEGPRSSGSGRVEPE